jgi:hypothetical protein
VRVVSKADRWPLIPFLAIIFGLAVAVLLNIGYTTWAISYHAHQSCSEVRIIATAGGAITPYDRTIKKEYQGLYRLRCR